VALCASVLPNRLHPIPKPRSGRQWGHFDHDSHAILRLSGFNVRAFSDRLGRLKRGWQRQKWALRSAPSARDRSDRPPLLMACTRQVILPSFTYSLHSMVPSRYRCHVGVQSKPHAVVTTAQTPTPGRTRGCGVCDNMAGLDVSCASIVFCDLLNRQLDGRLTNQKMVSAHGNRSLDASR